MSKRVLGHAVFAALLLGLGWWRLLSPDMSRPFEVDELLTVRYYTWAGVAPSGETRNLDRITDFYSLPGPTLRQMAIGVYCSAGRWSEPNNHIVNSLLCDLALVLTGRSERSARGPALLGGLVFAAALYHLCGSVLGWRAAAPLAALWAWFHPYTVVYSQTARGFSWMLALQVVQIILAFRIARTRRPLALGALCCALAVLSLLNVVSMAVDWVLPFYLALLLARPGEPGPDPEPRSAWRRYVMAQALAVAGMGGVFLVSHLPNVYSSAQQYGTPFASLGEFFEVALGIVDEMFPEEGDKFLAQLGAAGLVALLFAGGKSFFLRLLVVLTLGISLGHYAVAGRFPYARAMGHVIPLILLGAAYLVELAIQSYDSRAFRVAMFLTFAAISLVLTVAFPRSSLAIRTLSDRIAIVRDVDPPPGFQVFMPIREGLDYIFVCYCPRSWDLVDAVDIDQNLLFVEFRTFVTGTNGEGTLRLTRIPGKIQPLSDEADQLEALIFWYPDFLRLGLNASEQLDYVNSSGCEILTQTKRYPIKLDIFTNLNCVIFLPEPKPKTSNRIAVVREALRRFGGRAVMLVPSGGRTTHPVMGIRSRPDNKADTSENAESRLMGMRPARWRGPGQNPAHIGTCRGFYRDQSVAP